MLARVDGTAATDGVPRRRPGSGHCDFRAEDEAGIAAFLQRAAEDCEGARRLARWKGVAIERDGDRLVEVEHGVVEQDGDVSVAFRCESKVPAAAFRDDLLPAFGFRCGNRQPVKAVVGSPALMPNY